MEPVNADCLWLYFADTPNDKCWSDESEMLSVLDWKMRGQLRKLLANSKPGSIVFLPTMGKLATSYIVVDRRERFDKEGFFQAGKSLKVKSIHVACRKGTNLKALSSQSFNVTMDNSL